MTRIPFWLIPLVGVTIFLLTGALDRKQSAAKPAPVTDLGPLPDGKDAGQVLDQAIAAFQPDRVPWQRAHIWQRILTDSGSHEVQGRYLTGPNCRLRLELEVQVGKTHGAVQLISNGQQLWQRQRIGNQAARVTGTALPIVPKERANDPAFLAWRTRELHRQSFGVSLLLKLVRNGWQDWQGKLGQWNGVEVFHVSATCPGNSGTPAEETPIEGLQPPPRATRVCVFLDPDTLWPWRLEWWGEKTEGVSGLIGEMEFRTPVLNQPLTAEECWREFNLLPE